jgi:hypothetical protein
MPAQSHNRSRFLTALAAGALALAAPALADAAPYTITTCGTTGKLGGWRTFGAAAAASQLDVGSECPPRPNDPGVDSNWSPYRTGIYVTDTRRTAADTPQGTNAGWQLTAPTGATITRAQLWRVMRKQDDPGWRMYFKLGAHDSSVPERDDCTIAVGDTACGGAGEWGWSTESYSDLSGLSTSALSFGLRCETTARYPCLNGYGLFAARVILYEARVTLDDPTAPTTPTATGPAWTSTAWQEGSTTLAVSGTDPQSGIRETRLYIDGQLADGRDRTTTACDWSMPTPCSSASAIEHTLDTSTLADGPHDVSIATVNAAGVETRADRPTPLLVDNDAPAPPTVLTATRRGTTNTFDLSWQLPPDIGAPRTIVRWQLCTPSCSPTAETTDLAARPTVTLDGSSDGTFRVWAVDALGHENPAGAATVNLTFKAPPPVGRDPDPPARRDPDPSVDPDPGTPTDPPDPGVPTPRDPPTPPQGDPPRASAALRVAKVLTARRGLTVRGTVDRRATGRITVLYIRKVRGRTRRARAIAVINRGRWSVTLRLPRTMRGRFAGTLRVTYPGDREVRGATTQRRSRPPHG